MSRQTTLSDVAQRMLSESAAGSTERDNVPTTKRPARPSTSARRNIYPPRPVTGCMVERVDSARKRMQASPEAIYQAFAEPGAMERWLPPSNMTGEMLDFDFHEGGSYRMRLTYKDQQAGQGKTSEAFDEMEVRLPRLEPNHRIEQEVVFESDDPAFEGTMRMVWTFEPAGSGAIVTVRAENVPVGIQPEDHEAGMKSTLDYLTAFVEQDG